MDTKRNVKLIVAAVIILLSVTFACGVFNGQNVMYHLMNRGDLGPLTRDNIDYLNVEAPKATSSDGTVRAVDWKAIYPEITATMGDNAKNT